MSLHKQGPSCPYCEKLLETADPELQHWFREDVKPRHQSAHVYCAWRGQKEQDADVASGASEKPWPTSDHNQMEGGKPCSKALDIFEISEKGIGRWDERFFRQLDMENKAAKRPIKCGFKRKDGRVWDTNHFALVKKDQQGGKDA